MRVASRWTYLLGGVSLVVLLSVAMPAVGGPKVVSADSALSTAKKALSLAKKADKKADKALAKAGTPGPPGPQGPAGPAGDTGAPAPPRALADTGDDDLPADGTPVNVASLDLPAGSWMLIAKARATTTSNGSFGDVVICHLMDGDVSHDSAITYSQVSSAVPQNFTQTIPLTALITVGVTTTVDLRCSEANDPLTSSLGGAKLVAIAVTP